MWGRGSAIVVAFACLAGAQQQRNTPPSPSQATSPMLQVRALFRAAKPLKPAQLFGTWVKVKEVWTLQALTGHSGPDHVTGMRRPDLAGAPVDWKLTFRRSAGHIRAASQTAWQPSGDAFNVKFEANGDFIFEKQTGGDSNYVLRCRVSDSHDLVCLDTHTNGHGIEFRKIGTGAESNYPHNEKRVVWATRLS